MRINRLVIKKSGPLQNLDVTFKPITLVLGDNERGKTCFLNWVARCVFDKPSQNSFGEKWADSLDEKSDVQSIVKPLHHIYNGERMKNLLLIQEMDFYFKNKNTEHLSIEEFWDREINALLYGNDHLSDELSQSFLRAMGVGNSAKNSWLSQLHAHVFELKNVMEELIPDVNVIQSKEQNIQGINKSLGQIDQQIDHVESKQEMFFLADKIALGKKYLDGIQKYYQIKEQENENKTRVSNYEQSLNDLKTKEDSLFDYEDKIADLKTELSHLADNKTANIDSYSVSGNIFRLCVGTLSLIFGLFLAYQTRTSPFNIVKLVSLISFGWGLVMVLITWFKSMAIQLLSKDNNTIFHDYLEAQSQKKYHRKSHELEKIQREFAQVHEECQQLRRTLKTQKYSVPSVPEGKGQQDFITYLEDLSDKVYEQFSTDDPQNITREIGILESRMLGQNPTFNYNDFQEIKHQKDRVVEEQGQASQEYSRLKSKILNQIKPLIENIKTNPNKEMVDHFYPEVSQIELKGDFTHYLEIVDRVQTLSDVLSKDRYYAEKLVEIYKHAEEGRDVLLAKVLNMPLFVHLIQATFGGKYQGFTSEIDLNKKVRLFAHTGSGERYPLESLSSATCGQFWLIFRLVVAKIILKEETGIILLDDPFVSFDTLRKQHIMDMLNAFAHQGWQIVCTLTDDSTINRAFHEYFGDALQVVDLNKDTF